MLIAGAILVSALSAFLLTGSSGGQLLRWLKGQQKGGSAFDLWHGQPAPDLTLTLWDQRVIQLQALRGQPVVLEFWTSWSPPCRANLQALDQLARARPDITFLGIAVEDPATARPFAESLGLTFPQGSMSATPPPPFDQIIAVPTTFFVDASGLIIHVSGGYLDPAALDRLFRPPPGA